MENHLSVVLASSTLQAALCLLMALVLGSLYRTYRRNAIRIIALSWLALALYFGSSSASIGLSNSGYDHDHPIRLAITAVGLAAAYTQVALLLIGTAMVVYRKHLRPWLFTTVFLVIAAGTLASTLAFVGEPELIAKRIFVRIGVRSMIAGLAFIAGALYLRRASRPPGVGHGLVTAGFLLYGLQQLVAFTVTAANLYGVSLMRMGSIGALVESVWLGMIGIGSVVWLLEVDRDRLHRTSRELESLTQVDQITGTATRQRFLTSLGLSCRQARLTGQGLGVVVADVDGFRTVITTMGRGASDELLRVLAERFQRVLPAEAVLARLERDEFAISLPLPDSHHPNGPLEQLLANLREVARPPCTLSGQEVYVTVSAGAACFPGDGNRPEALLRAAESALDASKGLGPDRYRVYDDTMSSLSWERLRLETALRKALEEGQFELHYQPIVALPSRKLLGFEALLRWRHPDRGLLRPAEFLGSAEAIGILPRIEEWVLGEACRQRRVWGEVAPQDLRLSLNLSPDRFHRPRADRWILDAIREQGLAPSQIELEITESRALMSTEQVLEGLAGLREAGCAVSLDDFGTGYSSLASLRQIPATTLKVDQSFIRHIDSSPQDASFVASIAGLAHALNMRVVVEGVERESQAAAAHQATCDAAQGHLFGLPVPADTATSILRG